MHEDSGAAVLVDPEKQDQVILPAKPKLPTPPKVKQGYRNHKRKRLPVTEDKEGPTQATTAEQEEVFEGRRQALRAWEHVDTHIYSKGRASTGGAMTSTRNIADATMTIATLNVRGLNDAKLELVLQFFVAQEWDILFLIDTQLDKKGRDFMGKKIKRRLGTGTRTHTCPCIMDYETDTITDFSSAGEILAVVGPKWGTSLGQIQEDKFKPAGASAGVMMQFILDTFF